MRIGKSYLFSDFIVFQRSVFQKLPCLLHPDTGEHLHKGLSRDIFKLGNAFITTGLSLGNTLQLIFAVLLLILGVIVAVQGIKKLFERNSGAVKA